MYHFMCLSHHSVIPFAYNNLKFPDKVKQGANITLLLLMVMAVYSHYMVNDKFERTAPALVSFSGGINYTHDIFTREVKIFPKM